MEKILRPFQQKAIEKVVPLIGKKKKILISMAQGSGKPFTILNILKEYLYAAPERIYREKILLIVDNEDSLNSLEQVFREVFKNDIAYTRNLAPNIVGSVCITTAQRLIRNKNERFKQNEFQIIVLLNCEKIGFGTIKHEIHKIVDFFNPSTFIGIDSFVEKSKIYFGEPVYSYTIQNALEDGCLLPCRMKRISLDIKDKTVIMDNMSHEFLLNDNYLEMLAKSILEETLNQKTIVFCPDTNFASRLSKFINHFASETYSSAILHDKEDNDEILSRYEREEFPYLLTNVKMLFTKADFPSVRNIVLLNKYQSHKLLQMISGFMLPYPGKEYLTVLDYVGTEFSDSDIESIEIHETSRGTKPEQEIRQTAFFTRTKILLKDKSEQGVLGVKDLAEELADIILDMPCEQGRMIGIFGEWGRGKTFLMEETWKCLQKKKNIYKVDFLAWKYQDTPAIWAYLYERFAESYYSSVNWFVRIFRRLKLNFMRLGWWNLIWFLISLSVTLVIKFAIPWGANMQWMTSIWTNISLVFLSNILVIFFSYKNSARELFRKYYSKPSFKHLLGTQAEVQKELKHLVKAWCGCQDDFKILLFVDDIDRCSEEKIIQLIDSLRVMLEDAELSKRLTIVTAIDDRILKRAVKCKYFPLIETYKKPDEKSVTQINRLVTEYLDKLFITGIKLGHLNPNEIDEFFIELTKNSRKDKTIISFEELSSYREYYENTEDKNTLDGDASDADMEDDTLEEEDGSIESSYSIENEKETNLNSDKKQEEPKEDGENDQLSDAEFIILRQKLQLYNKITPRQIRIFYYRYLIAKNLLIRQYKKINRGNIWISTDYSPLFIELLINLSSNSNAIEEERKTILNSKDLYHKSLLFNMEKIETLDCKMLICVLDTVIGY